MINTLLLFAGLTAAGAGGELFVRGLVGVSRWARIPAGIVGATIAAFATSVPELATVVIAQLRGHDEIGLGTVLGSNVFNGLFIVAVAR